ncbi:MaoC family dehydratase N-terminal domain-containing protein, partial [Acinetobacter baumannii]
KTETRHDQISPAFAAALAATLDGPRQPQAGDALPPLWQWIYFWSVCRPSEVGGDGQPQRGGFLPPVPLPRRMWAGGELNFIDPLRVGDLATRVSRISDITLKSGSTGQLCFVSVE